MADHLRRPVARSKPSHRLLRGSAIHVPERVALAVQVLSVLGLLATVVFAYLSWREARLAREDQASYFLAEKAPQIKIVGLRVNGTSLFIQVRNIGDSLATRVSANAIFNYQGLIMLPNPEEAPKASGSLHKGQTIEILVNTPEAFERAAQGRSWELTPLAAGDTPFSSYDALVFVAVAYEDVRGNMHKEVANYLGSYLGR